MSSVPRPSAGLGGVLAIVLALGSGACSSVQTHRLDAPVGERVVVFVPGVGGDGATYAGLKRALAAPAGTDLRILDWGLSGPFFVLNLQDPDVHAEAETALARWLETWRAQNPRASIDLVGHSAGCGVILGALKRLPAGGTPLVNASPVTPLPRPDSVDRAVRVRNVVLLASSVSPGYDLQPALRHVAGRVHSFHSDRDVWSLKWRTSASGTYDNVKTPAAGHAGFACAHACLAQHAYDAAWDALGNDGGHSGSVAESFVRAVVAPLLGAK
ncbi:MAG: hypothetical protein ACAI43_13890 [Phycisphaerae bacterium]|nr:hypothetical protein [Tepidisphaeraceae bacterium]